MAILQIKDLSFKYNESDKCVIDNLNISIKEGEFVVVCGESGCGKSTLLKLIKHEIAPYGDISGKILYKNYDITDLPKRTAASEFGYVQQDPETQIVTDYVWHELAFGLESLGYDNAVIRRRVSEMASYFGIQDWFRKKTDELSGGQKQLMNLASVMVMNPRILLLDEPTSQLDPISASNFISTLKKLNVELGITIIIVEHRLEELLPIADKVLLLSNGRTEFYGAPSEMGEYFSQQCDHPMFSALPTAMRVFSMLGGKGNSPITVRDGRNFISSKYNNNIRKIENDSHNIRSETALELKNVYFRYSRESSDILSGVNIKVCKGEHFCILGGNGTGKTTTLNVMSGLLRAYRGKVIINEKEITKYKKDSLYLNNLAVLPQSVSSLFSEMTVRDELLEMCRVQGMKKEESIDAVCKIASKLSIDHLLDSHPYDLSGGEQQKTAFCKVLLTNPSIIFLDEPTKAIDSNSKLVLASIIKKLCEEGKTVITVTHDVEFAAMTAERCAMFFSGEVVSVGETNSFFTENNFYTTAAYRMTQGYFDNTILCDQVVQLCIANGKKDGKNE